MIASRQKRHAARRRLYEAAGLTDAEFGLAVGWTQRTVQLTARRESWRKAPASRAELARRTRRLIEARLEKIEDQLGRRLGAARENALNGEALKIYTALNAPDRSGSDLGSGEGRVCSDAELTEALRKVDERIEELAREYALQLVALRIPAGTDASGGRELAAAGDAAAATASRAA